MLLCGNYVNIYFFEFINARIFSCQFFKYLPISSALKRKYKHSPAHFVRSQPEIIHLTPGATRTLVFYFISWKKGSNIIFNSSEFYLWLKGHSTHNSFQKTRGICLMKLTIKKFQNLPFFLIQNPN